MPRAKGIFVILRGCFEQLVSRFFKMVQKCGTGWPVDWQQLTTPCTVKLSSVNEPWRPLRSNIDLRLQLEALIQHQSTRTDYGYE